MSTDPITITYRIQFSDESTEVFDFNLDGETGNLTNNQVNSPPAWAELEYKQCSHCPLTPETNPHCPIALQLHNIIERFHETSSIDEVDLEVITEERIISQHVPLQRAIGSMLGLVSPTCGCPKMAYMKPMARFHLPLSTEEETAFRVTGMYLLAQNFLDESDSHFDGLKEIYGDLHILNKAIASRLKTATESDSSKNAIALLDMYSNLVPMMIEDQLTELQSLFAAFLPEGKTEFPNVSKARNASLGSALELVPTDEASGTNDTEEKSDSLEFTPTNEEAAPSGEGLSLMPTEEDQSTGEGAGEEPGSALELVPTDSESPASDSDNSLELTPTTENPEELVEKEEFAMELESLLAPEEGEKTFTLSMEDNEESKPRGKAVFKLPDDDSEE